MSKTLKNILVSVLTVLFCLTMVFAVASFSKNFAFAQNQELPAQFEMSNGAKIREIETQAQNEKDENGIRFSTTITKAFFDAIELNDGETITFYTLVKKDAKTVEEVKFGGTDVMQAEWKINDESWAGTFDESGKYVRNIDLMNFPEEMYSSVFAARSCYVISDNNDETENVIVYADGENSIRSMEGVAIKYLTDSAETFAHLNKYVGLNEDGEILINEKIACYGANKGSLQIDNTGLTGEVRVYNGSKFIADAKFENGKLTLPATEINNINNVYTLTDGNSLYQQNIKTVDYAIAGVADFKAWMSAFEGGNVTTTEKVVNAALLNDIDFVKEGEKITNQGGCLRGTLDGNGYTINGLEHSMGGLFYSVSKEGGFMFKNVAFTNVVLSRANGSVRYLIASGNVGNSLTFTNSFVHVLSAPNAIQTTSGIGIVNDGGTLNVNESVFYFEFTYGATYNNACVFRASDSRHNVNNFYAISNNALSAVSGDTLPESEKYVNYARYATVADYINDIENIKANVCNESNANASMWDVQDNYFMFASARKYLEVKPVIAVEGSVGGKVNVGNTYNVSATYGADITLKNAPNGVTLNGDELTIAQDVQSNSTFELVATYTNNFGKVISSTQTYTVVGLTEITISGAKINGANRDNLVVDLSSYGTLSSISNAYVDGVDVTANASLSDNKLTVAKSAFTVNTTESLVAIIDDYKFTLTVKTVDFAIGTTDEFVAWADTIMDDRTLTGSAIYAVLTADIDLTSKVFAANATSVPTTVTGRTLVAGYGYGSLRGELDGQGHTVDGLMHTQQGMFANIANCGFTLKNIAFTNIDLNHKTSTTTRYIFTSKMNAKMTMENVYLQVTKTSAASTAEVSITNDCGMLALKNCVIDFAFTYAEGAITYDKAVVFRNRTPQYGVENVFAISKTTFLASSDTLVPKDGYTYSNNGRYESATALATAISKGTLDMSMFTSSSYWDTTAGYPVWKIAKV